MPVFGTQMFGSGGGAAAYSIENSLCFNDDDSPSLSFTPSSAGNRRTWTLSFWFKLCKNAQDTGAGMNPFSAGGGNFEFVLSDGDSGFYLIDGGGLRKTSNAFRDMSGWVHLILASDSTQGSESNRMKMYHNGVQITNFSVNNSISQNKDYNINTAAAQVIGQRSGGYWDGYLAEFIFVDGTQQAATDLGEFDDNGVWRPIDPSELTFGTNGYWLKFANSSSLGTDSSGNGNNFTPSNLAATDQVTDSPTKNYTIMNYNDAHRESSCVLSEGCLKWTNSNTGNSNDVRATFGMSSGKWYWECELDTLGQSGVNKEFVGVVGPAWDIQDGSGGTSFPQVSGNNGYAITTKGEKITGNTTSSYGSAMSAGDIVGVALDLDNGKIWFSINGTYPNSGDPAAGSNEAFSSLSGMFQPAFAADYGTGNSTLIANFGQRSFNTAAPAGFKEVRADNFSPDIPDGSTNFQAVIYSGTGSSNAVTFDGNSNMQPDAVLLKQRDGSRVWTLYDAARGVEKYINWNDSDAESESSNSLTAFGSDGFTVGSGAWVNVSSGSFLGYGWSAGNSGSSNTDGSINTTTTYVDATAGISISTYTGTGSAATVGHGLGTTPVTVFTMPRSNGDHRLAANWEHGVTAFTEKLKLNDNEAPSSSSNQITGASSTTFSIGTDVGVNGSGRTYVAYAFAEVEGFSRFGTYVGNGSSDGAFAYCGFEPAFFVSKRVDSTSDWIVWDNKRSTYNVMSESLVLNDTAAEGSADLDFLSNGVKIRNSDASRNADGGVYIFWAFAKYPLGGDGLSPAPGR
jgi:hypothetical protein